MPFFSLFPSCYVDENAIHHTINNSCIISLTSRRDPPNFLPDHDAKIDLVGPLYSSCCIKCCSYPISVGRMNSAGEIIERDILRHWDSPKIETMLVHRELVRVHVP